MTWEECSLNHFTQKEAANLKINTKFEWYANVTLYNLAAFPSIIFIFAAKLHAATVSRLKKYSILKIVV